MGRSLRKKRSAREISEDLEEEKQEEPQHEEEEKEEEEIEGNLSQEDDEDQVEEEQEEEEEEAGLIENDEEEEEQEEQVEEKKRLRKEAEAYRAALDRRGVVYLSRIPPFMKPNKMRTLLEPYGEITRLFLAEEDAEARKKRKDKGGNASRQFREGWVEFADKKVARAVADSLNNTAIGGRKGDFYHDDIWNLKYLKKFKWEYLTEKLAYERRVRENRLRTAMMQAKKNNAEIVDLIERTKVAEAIAAKKKAKLSASSSGQKGESVVTRETDRPAFKRKFHQRTVSQNEEGVLAKAPKAVLRSVFPEGHRQEDI